MIDTDIHVLINEQELLTYIEPAQREWFASRSALGLPDYPLAHPIDWFRADAMREPGQLPASSLGQFQADVLDAYQVDVGLLNAADGVGIGLMPSSYRATALARAHNEWFRERFLEREPRLRGAILVPTQDPQAAAAEIRRVAEDQRFSHVLLVGGAERPYGEPRYLPIFEAAAECGLPVAIHSGAEGIGIAPPSTAVGHPSLYIEWHTLGSSGSIMAHLVSLLCHGIFERLPSLKVLMMEGGLAWLPGILWRLDTNWRGLRQEVPWLSRLPSEVAREHVRFSTQPLEHTNGNDRLLWEMLEAVGGPDILCFASDYPHWDFDDPSAVMARLPREWRQRVMHDNAAELFGARLNLAPATA
jgi:predicted TIM-barrel fold metal-dependent hydrolase